MVWAVFHRWSFLGMVLMRSSMTARRAVEMLRSVDLGSHRRSMPLVCSFVGLCQAVSGLAEVHLDA